MSRDAYIAGKNTPLGTSTPSVFSSSSEQQSFQAAQDEKAYVEKAKGNQSEVVQNYQFQTESYQNAPSPKEVAKVTGKDPYETGADTSQGIYAPEEKKDWVEDIKQTVQKAGGVLTSIPVAFFKKLAHPEKEDFLDPNFLATMKMVFDAKEKEIGSDQFKKDFLADYQELINEAYGSEAEDFKEAQGFNVSGEDLFNQKLSEAGTDAFFKTLNPSVQFNVDPSKYMKGEGKYFMPQTTGGLESLASLDAQKYLQGEFYDPKLAQMIFDARETLGTEKLRQEQRSGQGVGAGIADLEPAGILSSLPEDEFEIIAGPFDPPQGPGIPGEIITKPVTLPDGTVVNMPATTTPMPFNYAQWPQFGPAGGPVPNYVNQGLGQGPQFDYWNSIANAFPGMR